MERTTQNNVPIKALIVDDEEPARKRIRDLTRLRRDFEIVGESRTGSEAIEAIRSKSPDLVFLDVQMPDMNGFDVLERTEARPIVIFVTAYDKFALKAFEVHAVDYLLKPFDDERFEEMLDHAAKQIKRNQLDASSAKITSLLESLNAQGLSTTSADASGRPSHRSRLMLKSVGKISFVDVEDVDWIGAEGSYVSLHVAGKSHLLRDTLKNLERVLDPDLFLRIHRSTMVNVTRIKELRSHTHGELVVILKDGTPLKLSRNYREQADALLTGRS